MNTDTLTLDITVTVVLTKDVTDPTYSLHEMLAMLPRSAHDDARKEYAEITHEDHCAMSINGAVSATLKHLHDASGQSLPLLVDGTKFDIEDGRPEGIAGVHVSVSART